MKFNSFEIHTQPTLRYDCNLPSLRLPATFSIANHFDAAIPPMAQPDLHIPMHRELIAEALRPDADRRNVSHNGNTVTFDTLSRSNFSNTPDLKVTVELVEDPEEKRKKWVTKCVVHRPALASIMAAYFDVPTRPGSHTENQLSGPSNNHVSSPAQAQLFAEQARKQRASAISRIKDSKEERLHKKNEVQRKKRLHVELNALSNKAISAQGLQPNELELAGYLLRRAVDKRVSDKDDPASKKLRSLNSSVLKSRENIQRGNVTTDIKSTNHGSTRRLQTVRDLERILRSKFGIPSRIASAASAKAIGAGNCGENSDLIAHKHAQQLQPGERLVNVSGIDFDHAFTELRSGKVISPTDLIVVTTDSGNKIGIVNDGVNVKLGADGRLRITKDVDIIDLGENAMMAKIGGVFIVCNQTAPTIRDYEPAAVKREAQITVVGDNINLTSITNMVVTKNKEGRFIGIYNNGTDIKFDDAGQVVGLKSDAQTIEFSRDAEVAQIGNDRKTLAIYDKRPIYKKDENRKNTEEIIGYNQHIIIVGDEGNIGGDSWGEGPAFFAEDGKFTDNPLEINSNYAYDSISGPGASRMVSNLTDSLSRSEVWQDYIDETLKAYDAENYELPSKYVWSPTKVIGNKFLARTSVEMGLTDQVDEDDFEFVLREIEKVGLRRNAGVSVFDAAKQTGSYELRNEILAAGVSINHAQEPVREATQKAPSVIEAAKKLGAI